MEEDGGGLTLVTVALASGVIEEDGGLTLVTVAIVKSSKTEEAGDGDCIVCVNNRGDRGGPISDAGLHT